jgi:hypothetical protein
MAILKNRAKMSTSTTGTGTITLGSAESGYQTFADAGVANADVVRYVIEDGNNWEIGTGTYTATGTTLSRTVSESSNSDAAINLSGSATVFIGATAEDIPALYADNDVSATAPSAAGDNSVAIGSNASTPSGNTGAHSISIGRDAFARNQFNVAIGRGAEAGNSLNTGNYSGAFGHNSLAYKQRSIALGTSRSGGDDSLAAAITNNTSSYGATGANSIAIGRLSKASSADSFAIGDSNIVANSDAFALGNTNNVTGGATAFAIGTNHTVSGTLAACIGGSTSTATQTYAMTFGPYAKAAVQNAFIFGSKGWFSAGSAQGGMYILYADTTDATATVLTTTNSTAGNTNQIVAASDTCIMFSGTLVAMQNGAQDQGGWEIKGLLKNDGGTTTLVSSNIQTFAEGNGWVVALTADNTNNALAITCTGEAAHNIRWVANIQTSEVTYA